MKSILPLAAAILLASSTSVLAQNQVIDNNADAVVTTAPDAPAATETPPAPAPAPAAPVTERVITTTTAPELVLPPPQEPVSNPYANGYNEVLPLEPEDDGGFNDWGLLGLLGLLGLFGLAGRRERIVYVERAEVDPLRTGTNRPTIRREEEL
jgi:MYXO-CTERM domain-containing protein